MPHPSSQLALSRSPKRNLPSVMENLASSLLDSSQLVFLNNNAALLPTGAHASQSQVAICSPSPRRNQPDRPFTIADLKSMVILPESSPRQRRLDFQMVRSLY